MRKGLTIVLIVAMAGMAWAEEPATRPAETKPARKEKKRISVQEELEKKLAAAELPPMLEKFDHGGIDWTAGTVYARGRAKCKSNSGQDVAMARRAARLVAARNAILLINKVRVDPGGKYPQLRMGDVRVDALIEGFKVVSSEHIPHEQAVNVLMEVPLFGAKGVVKTLGLKPDKQFTRAWGWVSDMDSGASSDVVIVDARGIRYKPTLFPQIVTESSERVFGLADVPSAERGKRNLAVHVYMEEQGISKQARLFIAAPIARAKRVSSAAGGLERGLSNKLRKGFRNPIIIPAECVAKDRPGTLVLSSAVLKELAIRGEARKLMRQGRLVILTDLGSRANPR